MESGSSVLRYLRYNDRLDEYLSDMVGRLTAEEFAQFKSSLNREKWRNKLVPVLTLEMMRGVTWSISPRSRAQNMPITYSKWNELEGNHRLNRHEAVSKRVRDLTDKELSGIFDLIEYIASLSIDLTIFSNTQKRALRVERKNREKRE